MSEFTIEATEKFSTIAMSTSAALSGPAAGPAPAPTAPTAAPGNADKGGSSKGKSSKAAPDASQAISSGGKKKKSSSGGSGNTSAKPVEVEETEEMKAQIDSLYSRVRSVGEECILDAELRSLIKRKVVIDSGKFNLYDGFEPSGRMHIAQGVFKAMNVNKCTSSGGRFIFWVADWFALMNDKMGGDLEKIKVVGEYLIQVWTAAGMDMSDEKVIFKWASDEITNNAATYWPKMIDIARRFTISRIKKCCQIMGRLEGNLTSAQVLYPLMQCTDVFFLKADVCQLGVDQRKVNMLAREYCEAAKVKFKPVILSHHMLYGLKAGQEKMSKSDPDSAIFMEDTAEDVRRKIQNAYCPRTAEASDDTNAGNADADAGKESMHLVEDDLKNPCLDYVENIIFCPPGATFSAGGNSFSNFADVRSNFVKGTLSEGDLKEGLIAAVNELLEPVRVHFSRGRPKELLDLVRQYKKEAAPIERQFRRLDAVQHGIVQAKSHIVFLSSPVPNPSLGQALDVLNQLMSGDTNSPVVLFLSDWSATVVNACFSDTKGVSASFKVLVSALVAIAPEFMKSVKIVKQSEAILKDPSNYWISVINAGRHFPLAVTQEGFDDSDAVGGVIARLMRVADAIAMSPRSIGFAEDGRWAGKIEANLVGRYYSEANIPLETPVLIPASSSNDLTLQDLSDEAHATENARYYLLDDPKVHGKAKIKKAFAEPGNVKFCPVIDLADFFALKFGQGKLCIQRSEENGGNIDYNSVGDIKRDFESGKLHPGDLKAAVTTVMVDLFTRFVSAQKADKELLSATKTLKQLNKKNSKKK